MTKKVEKKQTHSALKNAITKLVTAIDKYSANRAEWQKSLDSKNPQYRRKGLVWKNFEKTAETLRKELHKNVIEYGIIRINVEQLPFPVTIVTVANRMLEVIGVAGDITKYSDFFKRVLKRSKF